MFNAKGTTYAQRARLMEARGDIPWTWIDAVSFIVALFIIGVTTWVILEAIALFIK